MNYNFFDNEPKIEVKPENKLKPFTLMNDVVYSSNCFYGEMYKIIINKGYEWNGANIPRFLWRIVGSQYNPEFLPASMVHDWLCEHKDFIKKRGAAVSSDIFKDILTLYGVNSFKASVMSKAVKIYQLMQKGWQ